MDDIDREIEDFDQDRQPPFKPVELPADLTRWVQQNHDLVMRVQSALENTYDSPPTDEQLWEVIASTCSPEWLNAREVLRDAEKSWMDLNSPEKVALGPIGMALDSEEIDHAMERTAHSLAAFTIVNEGLRKREDLGRLLSVLLVQKRMLDKSAEQTRNLLKADKSLAALAIPSSVSAFARASHKPGEPFGIRDQFRHYAQRLLQRPSPNPRSSTRRESAPSSPGT
jgi:hypothetical protein